MRIVALNLFAFYITFFKLVHRFCSVHIAPHIIITLQKMSLLSLKSPIIRWQNDRKKQFEYYHYYNAFWVHQYYFRRLYFRVNKLLEMPEGIQGKPKGPYSK